jgi:predicted kinase/uncharacterized HAD superfamily protein
MTKKCIIVDIDGTVADCSHRLHHIKGPTKRWDKFWIGMENDKPLHHIITIVRAMYNSYDGGRTTVIVVTARDENVRAQTEAWLNTHGIQYDQLLMRGAADYRKDAIVKKEILDKIRADGYEVLFALEDRDHNVEMFRANDVPCLQVAADEDQPEERDWEGQHVLTLLVGPVCAGKSTFTQTFDPGDVVSSDEIREAITVWDRQDPEKTWALLTDKDHMRTWKAVHDLVRARVNNGLQTVVDATNVRARDRKAIVDLAPKTQRVEYVILDRPLEDKIRDRGWRSEELVRKMHETFQASSKHAVKGDGYPNVSVIDLRRVLGKKAA